MTENEYTNEQLIDFMYDVMDWRDVVDHPMIYAVIEELKEIQQYRAIGLTPELIEAMQGHNIALINDLGEYQQIGTIEEFKDLKEKNEPIANGEWIDTQPGYNNGYYKNVRVCSNCHDYYTTEYDEMKFCPKCGSKMTET